MPPCVCKRARANLVDLSERGCRRLARGDRRGQRLLGGDPAFAPRRSGGGGEPFGAVAALANAVVPASRLIDQRCEPRSEISLAGRLLTGLSTGTRGSILSAALGCSDGYGPPGAEQALSRTTLRSSGMRIGQALGAVPSSDNRKKMARPEGEEV